MTADVSLFDCDAALSALLHAEDCAAHHVAMMHSSCAWELLAIDLRTGISKALLLLLLLPRPLLLLLLLPLPALLLLLLLLPPLPLPLLLLPLLLND
jgi:hypothetical protein